MAINPTNPLIVQSDKTLLLDVHAPLAEEARSAILPFAELEKSPEHIHTYRVSPLSLWNAASAGMTSQTVADVLAEYSRYPVPKAIVDGFSDIMARYGALRLIEYPRQALGGKSNDISRAPELPPRKEDLPESLLLVVDDKAIRAEIAARGGLTKYLVAEEGGFRLQLTDRGTVKRELIKLGWPVKDEAPLAAGEPLEIKLRLSADDGGSPSSCNGFTPRDYQLEAARSVVGDGRPGSGYGVIVLPCGAGKTVVGMTVMSLIGANTLVLTTNVAAVHQWIDELIGKTELTADQIGEYTGDNKTIRPVTVATYQILTWRPNKEGAFPHFRLFRERAWGLVIYDEVHLLPAPVFRVTAELQAVRRLGLTATLVREDGAEDAVFSLVGPKRYDVPWKELEAKGWIAQALCVEIRVDLPEDVRIPYAIASQRSKYRIASENPLKRRITQQLIDNHPEDRILVIGQYLKQLEELAGDLKAPLITGKTPNIERETIYAAFRRGETRVIVVSKVANFAIDLPDASMAIQVSGSFGSRQEEAQRLGRILRPKRRNSYFYTVVSRFSVEEEFAAKRQKFLAEQGYKYAIQHWTEEELR